MIKVTLEFETYEDAIIDLGAIAENRAARKDGKPGPTVAGQAAREASQQIVEPKPPTKRIKALLDEYGLQVEDVVPTGRGGAITKEDILQAVEVRRAKAAQAEAEAEAEPESPLDNPNEPVDPEPVEDEPAQVGEVPTIEGCTAALKEVSAKKDLATCREILARFGVNRVTEIPENRRAEFVQVCGQEAA